MAAVRTRLSVSLGYFDLSRGNTIIVDGTPPISVVLVPETGGPADRASAEIVTTIDIPESLIAELTTLAESHTWGVRPPAVDALIGPIEERHRDAARAAVELSRWMLRSGGDHRSLLGMGLTEWSSDGANWRPIPADMRPSGRAYVVQSLPAESIEELSRAGTSEPVGHALLREAIGNIYANPRSSLIVGVAALEVGLKEAINDLDPVAGWLVSHAPSPPIDRMLRDLVPILPARIGEGWRPAAPPKMAITLVRKAVEARNGLVHLGSGAFDRPTLEVFLEVVGDLLYMLDFYRGQAWAVQRIKHASLVSAMREP